MVATLCLPTKQTRISYELDEEDEDCKNVMEIFSNLAVIDKNMREMELALESMIEEEMEMEDDGDNMDCRLTICWHFCWVWQIQNQK